MAENEPLMQRWQNYRPSKTMWFWSMLGAVILAIIVGFSYGGWTTAGTANIMAQNAAIHARSTLAASVCVQKFVSTADASEKLAELKKTSSWQRDDFIDEGGWSKLAGMEKPVPGSSELCADELIAMESLPEAVAANGG